MRSLLGQVTLLKILLELLPGFGSQSSSSPDARQLIMCFLSKSRPSSCLLRWPLWILIGLEMLSNSLYSIKVYIEYTLKLKKIKYLLEIVKGNQGPVKTGRMENFQNS